MRSSQSPVVIVGAGPTGLTLALLLAEAGLRSTLVERKSGPLEHPAACILSTRTMEVFRGLGLADAILERCQDVFSRSDIRWVTTLAGRELGRLSALPPDPASSLATSPVHTTHFPQNRLEPLLWDRVLAEPRITFLPSTRCRSVGQSDGLVEVALEGSADAPPRISGEVLVACDGANSTIRPQIGIHTSGRILAHMLGIHFTADLRRQIAGRESILYWVFNPRLLGVLIGHWLPHEWVLLCPWFPPVQSPDDFDDPRCRALVEAAVGFRPADLHIRNVAPWVLGSRLAPRYRRGRVLLAGDAAHTFPPTGGLGLNTGVQDAHNLAWKLAAFVRGTAGPALLETYQQERRPVARTNLDHSVGNYEDMADLLRVVGLELMDQRTLDALLSSRIFGALPRTWQRRILEIGLGQRLSRLGLFESAGLKGERARRELTRRIPAQAPHYRFLGLDLGVVYRHGALAGTVPPPETIESVSRYRASTRPGARLPHVWVVHRGVRVALHDMLSPDGFVLLTDDRHVASWATAASKNGDVRVSCFGIGTSPSSDLVDVDRAWPVVSELEPGGALLVRPDGHVAWRARTAPSRPTTALGRALEEILGQQPIDAQLQLPSDSTIVGGSSCDVERTSSERNSPQ